MIIFRRFISELKSLHELRLIYYFFKKETENFIGKIKGQLHDHFE